MIRRASAFRFRPQVWDLEGRFAPAVLSDNLSADTSDVVSAVGSTYEASSFGTDATNTSLTNVTLLLANPTAGTAAVDIFTDSANAPGTLVGTLTAPASFSTSMAETSFTSSGLALSANTTYWVVLRAVSGQFDWAYTLDNSGSGSGFQHTYGESTDAGVTWFTGDVFPPQMSVTAGTGGTGSAGTVAFDTGTYTVAENGGTVSVTLTRTGGSTGAVSVPITVSAGSATGGTDYTGVPTTVTFADGATTASATVTITDDTLVESGETATFALGSPTGGATLGGQTTTVLTITDNDTATGNAGTLSFAAADFSTSEGAGTVTVMVVRTGSTAGAVSATVNASGGGATVDSDFSFPTTVSFADGQSTANFVVTLLDDTATESLENVVFTLSSPTGGAAIGTQATVNLAIADNDSNTATPGTIAFASATYATVEGAGTATITLTRTGGTAGAVTVPVSVSGGTATAGTDYTGLPTTVSFADGQSSATFTVTITNDAAADGSETATFSLSNPTGGATLGTQASTTLTIADTDTAAALAFAGTAVSAGEGAGTVTLTINRTGDPTTAVTVPVTVTGGTATAGTDFTGTPATVSFAAGATTATLTLTLANDTAAEAAETIVLTLGTPTGGATLGGQTTATVTVTDDDAAAVTRLVAAAAGSGSSTVLVYNADGTTRYTLNPFPGFTGGSRVATADITGDGVDDIVVGAGPGGAARVVVYDGATGSQLAAFTAFEEAFTGGVYVAAGDTDGDGFAEVVVTPDQGGGPVVAVYSGAAMRTGTVTQAARFLGIDDPNFRGGARAALGTVNGDTSADLIVAAGFGGGPRVAIFNGTTLTGTPTRLVNDFFAFETTLRNGAFVAAGEGSGVIAFGGGPGGGPRVRVYTTAGLSAGGYATLDAAPASARVADFFAGDTSLRGGVRVALADLTNDGTADLVTASGDGQASGVKVYTLASLSSASPTPADEFDPFGATLTGGVFVG